MRIAVISAYEKIGGADLAAFRLVEGFHALGGHDVERFVAQKDLPYSKAVNFAHAGRARRFLREWSHFAGVPSTAYADRVDAKANRGNLLKLVAEFAPDVINLHSVNRYSIARLDRDIAVPLSEIAPVAWTLHDMWPLTGCCGYTIDCEKEKSCGWEITRKMFSSESAATEHGPVADEARSLKSCGSRLSFISPSQWMADQAVDVFHGYFNSDAMPNGLDLDEFQPISTASAREALGLSVSGKLMLGVVSQTQMKRKGARFLIDAVQQLGADCRLCLAGAVSPSQKNDWPDDVIYLGPIGDSRLLRLAYSAANATVVPSLMDNLPNVLLESLACGTPCIGFRVGGIPEVIRDNQNGFLAEEGNASDLAQQMGKVISMNDDEHRTLRNQCREDAERRFGQECAAAGYIKLFEELRSRAGL